MENKKSVFKTLFAVDTKDYVCSKEIKQNNKTVKLDYLEWAQAWRIVQENYPNSNFEVREWDGKPYLYDTNLGYMVIVSITIEDITRSMWLPVMDFNNYAMKAEPYTITFSGGGSKTIGPATMRDISDTTMRCLVKCLAMFGLGLSLYSKHDDTIKSDDVEIEQPKKQSPPTEKQQKEAFLEEVKRAGIEKQFVALSQKAMSEKFNEWLHMKPELKGGYIAELKNQLTQQK